MPNVNFPLQAAQKVANIWNSDHAAADEGSFFVALNPTSGTGIATTTSVVDDAATASATHAQNVPVMYIQNGYNAGDPNGKSIYLKYLRMIVTAAPTSATDWYMSIRSDTTPRYTSGGSLIVPANINTGSAVASAAIIRFGAVVTTPLPSAASRLLARAEVQSSIPVVKDQWMFTFGDQTMPTNILTATGAKNINVPSGPIIVGPGCNIAIGMWGTANAGAPAWEFELGYVERPSGL
jgi:hypothetical protein